MATHQLQPTHGGRAPTRRWWVVVGSVAIALGAATIGFARWAQTPEWAATCPPGLRRDAGRARTLAELLASTERGRRWLTQAPRPLSVCFEGGGTGALRSDGVFVLPSHWSDRENAARWGHLLMHQASGLDWPEHATADSDCEAMLSLLMAAETRAHMLEIELRRELRVRQTRPGLAFESEYWQAPASERESVVSRFLDSPRHGSSLVQDYRRRCRRLRQRAEPPNASHLHDVLVP